MQHTTQHDISQNSEAQDIGYVFWPKKGMQQVVMDYSLHRIRVEITYRLSDILICLI